MLRFECDTCQRLKAPQENWLLGLAVENIGSVSARREIAIQSAWDDERAIHPLAVHFCSVACKDAYRDALFGPEPARGKVVSMPRPLAKSSARRGKASTRRPRRRA